MSRSRHTLRLGNTQLDVLDSLGSNTSRIWTVGDLADHTGATRAAVANALHRLREQGATMCGQRIKRYGGNKKRHPRVWHATPIGLRALRAAAREDYHPGDAPYRFQVSVWV